MGPKQRARPAPGVISQELEGETMLLEIESESWFTLDDIGSQAWGLLRCGAALDDIRQALLTEYDVAPAQLEADFTALLRELQDAGLIIIESV